MRAKNNAIGMRFGMLVITSDSGRRSTRGDVYWTCQCDCGNQVQVVMSNLRKGHYRSCGCKKGDFYRATINAKKPPHCTVDGCTKAVYMTGICYMHYTRKRNYGDVHYLTPEAVRRENNRNAQLKRIERVKPTTYRKLLGKHEHRRVAEEMAGRVLRPDEHVHHKDGNKHNNDPTNLEIMSAEDHLRLHAMERRRGA